jgi:hypothetical protein
MRQKFQMIRDERKNILKIREYAVVNKNLQNVATTHLREENFSLLYEEIYESALIKDTISRDGNLIRELRTMNFFPVARYAVSIAKAVVDLYESKDARQSELFFDDKTRPV